MNDTNRPSPAARIILFAIRGYQLWISPMNSPTCRFYPTCSAYALEAILRYGAFRGSVLSVRRILSCHPFARGGYDPPP